MDGTELEACLLSRSTLSVLIGLLPTTEHDSWVKEMSKNLLDFRNPEGLETFNCFKRICTMERNTNENYQDDQGARSVPAQVGKKIPKAVHKVVIETRDSSDSESETSVHTFAKQTYKP